MEITTNRQFWSHTTSPDAEEVLWSIKGAPGAEEILLHFTTGGRPEIIIGVDEERAFQPSLVVWFPAARGHADLSVLLRAIRYFYPLNGAGPKALRAAASGWQTGCGTMGALRANVWGDNRSLVVGLLMSIPRAWRWSGHEESLLLPLLDHPHSLSRTDWGRFFTAGVYSMDAGDTPLTSTLARRLSARFEGSLEAGRVYTMVELLKREGVSLREVEDALRATGTTTQHQDVIDMVRAAGFLILRTSGGLDPQGIDLLRRAVSIPSQQRAEQEFLHTAAENLAALQASRDRAEGAPTGPVVIIPNQVSDGFETEDDDSSSAEVHPRFARYFLSPVYFADGPDDPAVSDEASDLAADWADRLVAGGSFSLRGLLESEGLEPEVLDALLAGNAEAAGDDGVELVLAAGYLILCCTGALDAEGLDLLGCALAEAASADPGAVLFPEALRELREYRAATGR